MKNKIAGMIGIYLLGIVIAFLLIVGVFALPVDLIQKNVAESAPVLWEETDYPTAFDNVLVRMHPDNVMDIKTLLLNNRITVRDNYTDALMLLHAAYDGDESVLEKAMAVYRISDEYDYPLRSLMLIAQGVVSVEKKSYDRYWHGYLVILKPMLLFFNIRQIRIINCAMMICLFVWLCGSMRRKLGRSCLLCFLFASLFFMPFTVPLCMQYCTSTYVMLAASIVLLKKYDWLKKGNILSYYFFIIGMVVVYVDFLTFPLVTFGIPIIIWLLLENSKDGFGKKILQVMRYGIDWSIGYVGLWVAKWMIATIMLKKNIIYEGIQQVIFRSSSKAEFGDFKISVFKAWGSNVCNYVNLLYILFIIIGLLCICCKIRPVKYSMVNILKNEGIYLIVALTPFAWYGVFKNHSYSHGSFTFRCLFITVFAGMIFLYKWRKECLNEIEEKD